MDSTDSDNKAGTKLLGLVEELDQCNGAGVTELAERLDIAKSTAHYHLRTLCNRGFVVKSNNRYQISLRFLEIGERKRHSIPLYDAAKDQIDKLAQETDELAILMVEEQGLGVYLDKATGANAIDYDAPIGRFARLHNRALGKAILAYEDESRIREIIAEHGLPESTEETITSTEQLFEALERVRENGIARNHGEATEGIYGIAVPILDEKDDILGAVSIAGPSTRFRGKKMNEEFPEILSQARNIIELNVRHAVSR